MWEFTIEQCIISTSCLLVGCVLGYKLKKPIGVIKRVALNEPTKLVLVVREDLKLGKGKLISQCCHGTLSAYQVSEKSHSDLLEQWELAGQAKVVLKAKSLAELLKVKESADAIGISTSLIRDAGRTQIAPGTETVLALGPDYISKIDSVAGHLKLL